jgi:hypothetical protein
MAKTLADALEEIRQLGIRVGGHAAVLERMKKKNAALIARNSRLVGQREHARADAQQMQSLLIKVRDSGDWFMSALEFHACTAADGEELLKEIEARVGPRVLR